jgi:hypothetical protein
MSYIYNPLVIEKFDTPDAPTYNDIHLQFDVTKDPLWRTTADVEAFNTRTYAAALFGDIPTLEKYMANAPTAKIAQRLGEYIAFVEMGQWPYDRDHAESRADVVRLLAAYKWAENGSNAVFLGPIMQDMLRYTNFRPSTMGRYGKGGVETEELSVPYNSLYVALPFFNARVVRNEPYIIKGALISEPLWEGYLENDIGVLLIGVNEKSTKKEDVVYFEFDIPRADALDIESVLNGIVSEEVRRDPQFNREALKGVLTILINLLLYWRYTNIPAEEVMDPKSLKVAQHLRRLRQKARNAKRVVRRKLNAQIKKIEEKEKKRKKWFHIELSKKDQDKILARGYTGSRGSGTPHTQKIRWVSGYWRWIRVLEPERGRIWVAPYMKGSKLGETRKRKSKHDPFGNK